MKLSSHARTKGQLCSWSLATVVGIEEAAANVQRLQCLPPPEEDTAYYLVIPAGVWDYDRGQARPVNRLVAIARGGELETMYFSRSGQMHARHLKVADEDHVVEVQYQGGNNESR